MSAYDEYFAKAATKLDDIERRIENLRDVDTARAGSLSSTLAVQREKLATLRRAGAEVTPEMIQSFAAGLERLAGQVGASTSRAA